MLLGNKFMQTWLTDDDEQDDNEIEIPIQVNGKVRAIVKISKDAENSEVERIALENADVLKFIDGHEIVKKIYIPGRIFTIVIK